MSTQKPPVPAVSDQIKNTLVAMTPQFKAALPAHIPVDRFIRVAQTAILTNPDIMGCERNSLFAACIMAAQDGLLPNGKEAALVSFKGKATYMPMVAGILKKVRNSGDLASITPDIVYEKDLFEYFVDEDGPHIKHVINFKEPDRGAPVAAYAVAKTKDGAVYIEVMTVGQINDVRNSSKSKDGGPWGGPFADEMAKKSVIRRLAKRLPMSTDLEDVIQRDDQFYDFKEQPSAPKIEGKPNRLSKLMAGPINAVEEAIDTTGAQPGNDDEPV